MAVDTEVRLRAGHGARRDRSRLRRAVDGVAVEFDAPPTDWLPASMVAPGHPLATAAATACRTVLGREPAAVRVPRHHRRDVLLRAGLPTLPALGPGLLRRAHAADEWVSAAAVRHAAELYAELAREFCA